MPYCSSNNRGIRTVLSLKHSTLIDDKLAPRDSNLAIFLRDDVPMMYVQLVLYPTDI